MRLVAKFILAVVFGAGLLAVAPLALLVAGIARLLNWAELHGTFDGDEDARDRARWLNS